MATAKNAQVGPKAAYYRSKHDGQIHAALKFPQGYEDGHPEEYEPVDGYDPAKGDKAADEARAKAESDARVDRSGYVAPVMAHTPIGTNDEPLPATSLVYAGPGAGVPDPAANAVSHNDGGQVVVGGADRSMVRQNDQPPAPIEGTVNPSDVADAQIALNKEAVKAHNHPKPAAKKAAAKGTKKAK